MSQTGKLEMFHGHGLKTSQTAHIAAFFAEYACFISAVKGTSGEWTLIICSPIFSDLDKGHWL